MGKRGTGGGCYDAKRKNSPRPPPLPSFLPAPPALPFPPPGDLAASRAHCHRRLRGGMGGGERGDGERRRGRGGVWGGVRSLCRRHQASVRFYFRFSVLLPQRQFLCSTLAQRAWAARLSVTADAPLYLAPFLWLQCTVVCDTKVAVVTGRPRPQRAAVGDAKVRHNHRLTAVTYQAAQRLTAHNKERRARARPLSTRAQSPKEVRQGCAAPRPDPQLPTRRGRHTTAGARAVGPPI